MKITLFACFILLAATSFAQQSENLKKGIELVESDPDKAIKFLQKAIKENPKDSEAYYFLGLAKNSTNITAGLEELTKAIELNPCYSDAYNVRGGIYSFQMQTEKAFADYSKAIECDPKNGFYYYNRAIAANSLGKYQLAIEDCNKSLELEEAILNEIYGIRAEAKAELGDFKGAIADCDRMIAATGDGSPYNYMTRGNIRFKMKDYKGAIEDFLKASDPEMDGGYAFYRVGEAKLALNDQKGACEAFMEAGQHGIIVEDELLVNCK